MILPPLFHDWFARQGWQPHPHQLALLAAVDRTGQIAAAAQSLNMTQPAASRMLSELEHLLGVKLTARHPRGVNLTAAGTRLAELARVEGLGPDGDYRITHPIPLAIPTSTGESA